MNLLRITQSTASLSSDTLVESPELAAGTHSMLFKLRIDPPFEDTGRFEHHDAAGRNWHLPASFGISAHALALLAHSKQAERRQFYRFATFQAVRDFFEEELNESGAFSSRQPNLFIDRLV